MAIKPKTKIRTLSRGLGRQAMRTKARRTKALGGLTGNLLGFVLLIAWTSEFASYALAQDTTQRASAPYRPAFDGGEQQPVASSSNTSQLPTGQPAPPGRMNEPNPTSQAASQIGTTSQSQNPVPAAQPSAGDANQGASTNRVAVNSRQTQLNDQVTQAGPANAQWQQQGQSAATAANPIPAEITRVSKTFSSLPNDAGQVWREYDILPYTSQITNSEAPQQAVVDWILRQTGKDMWFSQPLGILSATREKLIVYHTPEIHNEINALVDRFVYTRGQRDTALVNLVTVSNPAWRESVYKYLQPIEVHSPGVEAWLVSKENAALLYNQLSQRSDFINHSSGNVTLHNGQPLKIEKRKPLQFVRSIRWTPGQLPGYQPLLTQMNEGYELQIAFLESLDGKSIDAAITCNVDQVEKLTGIKVQVPGTTTASTGLSLSSGDKMNLQIPQIVSWRLQERIRWPVDQVLLVSCGVVANLNSTSQGPFSGLLEQNNGRADALLFIDFRGPQNPRTAQSPALQGNLAPLPKK